MIWKAGKLALTVLMIATMTGTLTAQAPQTVELVSRVHPSQVSDTAIDALLEDRQEGPFSEPSISADGRYVVFSSSAPNLVPNQKDMNLLEDTSGSDVFLKDLVTGATTLVSHSVSSPTTTGNGTSRGGVISADGRYIAFVSDAANLAPGQATGYYHVDLLLFDRITGATMVLASIRTAPRDRFVGSLDIGSDGRYIAFVSDASDLVPGQAGGSSGNVFLCDRVEKTIRLVSHVQSSSVTAGEGRSEKPGISADGRFIVFTSNSGDLVPGQLLTENVFLYDRVSGAVTLIGPGEDPQISADGKYVLFGVGFSTLQLYSRDTNTTTLVSDAATGLTFGSSNVSYSLSADGRFVAYLHGDPLGSGAYDWTLVIYDRVTRTSTTASRPVADPPRHVDAPRISADGRFTVFISGDSDVVAGQSDPNSGLDVFLFDRSSGKTELVSSTSASHLTSGNLYSLLPRISANGTRVVFASLATDLVAGVKDLNEGWDFFDYQVAAKKTGLITASTIPAVSPPRGSMAMALSADGRFVAFESRSAHLVPGQVDSNRATDIFLYDRTTRTTVLVSRGSASAVTAANGESVQPSISADGRYVSFASNASNVAPGGNDPEISYDVFVFDRVTGTNRFVAFTRNSAGPETSSWFVRHQISQDGRWVAFTSLAENLVPGQQEPNEFLTLDVFLWDRTTGSKTLVSRSLLGATTAANQDSSLDEVSPDGRHVLFVSGATDLAPGLEPGRGRLFLFDRISGTVTLVTSFTGAGSMSADGRFIVLASDEPLDPGAGDNGFDGIYLHDRTLGTYRRIGYDNPYRQARISADGRYVTFMSSLPLLPDLNTTHFDQVYLYDRTADSLSLVSRSRTPGYSADGDSHSPAISADGRYVTFASDAPDLIPGQVPSFSQRGDDIYLFDRMLGTIILVSRWRGSAVRTSGGSSNPLISANGRQAAFTSSADLVEGDFNDKPDAYLFSLDPAGPVPLPTCTLLDTRRRADRPVLTSNVQRAVTVRGGCGVPATAKQVVVKVTVFNPTGKGNLRFYSGTITPAPSGILRFERGATRTETFTLPLSTNGTLTILPLVAGRGTVHVAVEVTGYAN